ncbi:MAG: hypothetical protein L0219_15730 [Phycisphaerales bacterium]|nr:hypothetical protein [Phycisphaerales bacterium]
MNLVRLVLVSALLALPGCGTTVRQTFDGRDPDQVWTAMIAVARTPDYSAPDDYTQRWTVRENQVWVDQANQRIEIFRRLERMLHRPRSQPLHEEREWKLQATLEERDPPTVRFTSRQLGVPAHAWDEAERYFDEVWKVLGGKPGQEPAPAPQPHVPPPPPLMDEPN